LSWLDNPTEQKQAIQEKLPEPTQKRQTRGGYVGYKSRQKGVFAAGFSACTIEGGMGVTAP